MADDEKEKKKVCWLTMALPSQKFCIKERCSMYGYKSCALYQGMNTISYYINKFKIHRKKSDDF